MKSRNRRRTKPLPASGATGGMQKAIAVILLILAAVGTGFFFAGESLIHRDRKAAAPSLVIPALPPPSPMQPGALKVLEAFFEAPDLESKAALVRDPDRVRLMMEDYHGTRAKPFPSMGRVSPGQELRSGETPLVFFQVEPFSGPRYPVAVMWDGHRFAVDWESLTAYGTMDWNKFLEEKPTAVQTMRLFIQNVPGGDPIPGIPAGHRAFQLEHRDDPQPLIAIADAKTAATLPDLTGKKQVPVILDVAWAPSGPGGTPVPRIVRFVSLKWSP